MSFDDTTSRALRIKPGESFGVKITWPGEMPPLYVVGLEWTPKWKKRKLRLAHLQAIKEDKRRDGLPEDKLLKLIEVSRPKRLAAERAERERDKHQGYIGGGEKA
jgi:hypothetical protein